MLSKTLFGSMMCFAILAGLRKCRIIFCAVQKSEISFVELEALYEYKNYQALSLGKLRENGYRGNMQGACRLDSFMPELVEYIHKMDIALRYDGESVCCCICKKAGERTL